MSQFGMSQGQGASPYNIERDLQNSRESGGFYEDFSLLHSDFTLAAGVAMPTATGTAPFLATVQSPLIGVRWDNAAGTTAVLVQLKLPAQYNAATDDLTFIPTLRYSGAGSDVATLRMTVKADYFQPGVVPTNIDNTTRPVVGTNIVAGETTLQTLDPTVSTAATVVQNPYTIPGSLANNYLLQRALPTLQASATVVGFNDYQFPLALGTPAKPVPGTLDINRFKPLTVLCLTIAPSIAVGASNNLDMVGAVLRWRRSASTLPFVNRFNRMGGAR